MVTSLSLPGPLIRQNLLLWDQKPLVEPASLRFQQNASEKRNMQKKREVYISGKNNRNVVVLEGTKL